MLPGMNQKQLQQAMKKLGVKQEEIQASEVIIKCNNKNLVIKNPNILKVNMMGQESLQITGEIQEETITEEDITTVAEQSQTTKEEAKKALKETNGDLAAAILKLSH